jgi:hypothetical protein
LSISTFNKILQKQGCVAIVCGLTLVGFVGTMLFQSCAQAGPNQQGQENPSDLGTPVAKIGDFTITTTMVERQLEQQLQGYLSQLPASVVLSYRGSALGSLVEQGEAIALAKKLGITATDEEVISAALKRIDEGVEGAKQQLIGFGQLKPNATPAEVEAALRSQLGGKTLAEYKADQEKQLRTLLQQPATRETARSVVYAEKLVDATKKKLNVTDDELTHSFDSFIFKKIYINTAKAGSMSPIEKARAIYNEIKGGLSFERAIDKYSADTPDPKKPLSEKTFPMARQSMVSSAQYAGLLSLKKGEMSQPIEELVGASIYKLIDVKTELPKDFAKNKETHRTNYINAIASTKLREDLKQFESAVKWEDKSFETLYAWTKLQTDTSLGPEQRVQRLTELLQQAKKSSETGSGDVGTLLSFNIFNDLYEKASPAQKKALVDQGVEIYELYFRNNEDPQARVRLADMLIEKGNGKLALDHLMRAAETNQYKTDPAGTAAFQVINSKIDVLQQKKLVTEEDLKSLVALQNSWKEQKRKDDAAAEEQRKKDEADKKAAEEAAKKAAKTPAPAGAPPKTPATTTGGTPKGK